MTCNSEIKWTNAPIIQGGVGWAQDEEGSQALLQLTVHCPVGDYCFEHFSSSKAWQECLEVARQISRTEISLDGEFAKLI